MDVDREMPELRALATYYQGALWVAESQGRIAGMIAARPDGEICRVYTGPALHGTGLGHALLDTAERHAIAEGAQRLFLYSDTRFARAHAFYEKRSYLRQGPVRVLHDLSNSLEYAYEKPVNGVRALDLPAAESAGHRLAEILRACVEEGATISFLPPMPLEKARAFWHRCAADVGAGRRVIVAGWRDGVLAAAGMLDIAMADNQPHVAEVQKVMADPAMRRTGLARQVLRGLEDAARRSGKTMMILDTREGAGGDALYRSEGWQEYGRLPNHAIDAQGAPIVTAFLYKSLA
jgi:GNAT superfamily N-acetyltransferase